MIELLHIIMVSVAVGATVVVITSLLRQIDYAKRMREFNGYYVYGYDTPNPYVILNAMFSKSGINTRVTIVTFTRPTDWFSLLLLSPKLTKVTICDNIIPAYTNPHDLAVQLANICIDNGSTFLMQFNKHQHVGFRIFEVNTNKVLSTFTLRVDAGAHGSSPCR